jgi:Phosphoglycerol transferase and related proteins, alkaline phosphatase superfamily
LKGKQFVEILNKFSILFHILVSLVLYFTIETISRHSFFDAWSYMINKPLAFLYNAFLIFITTLVAYLFRRRVFTRFLIFILWLILGIINGILLIYRVTPFTGPDLYLVTDALKIITIYMSGTMIVLTIVGAVVVLFLLSLLWKKAPLYEKKVKYKINIPLFVLMCIVLWGATDIALSNRILSSYFGNIAFAYEDYGFPYCLTTTIFNTGISVPYKYSSKSVEKLLNTEKKETENSKERPNIIFLQLESFFDPYLVEYLELSDDPIPNFRALSEAYSSGYFRVPSVGAGTANTEFESITGMSLYSFGPGEYPYKTILKKTTCESMAYNLTELGYTAHAIHNNEADFYDRNYVFSQLGFHTFTSEEYMELEAFTEVGWAKDKILLPQIMNTLESTPEQDYIYAISVQGHGEYPTDIVWENAPIRVLSIEEEGKKNAWEYYINQLYEMDQFIGELIQALTEYDEDVVLVVYGDHLPTLGLEIKDLKNRYLFQTQYIIWDNIGLPIKNQNLSAYQIGAEVLDQLDLHIGTIFTYHQRRKNTKNYQADLEELQYDVLYGKQYAYGGINPFEPTLLQMGVKEIEITGVRKITDEKIYVYGENFTQASTIEINGSVYETEFRSSQLLIVRDYTLIKEDSIYVNQISGSGNGVVLSQTKEYIWIKN